MENEIITTRSVGRGIAEIDQEFILAESPRTKTVFKAYAKLQSDRIIMLQRLFTCSGTGLPGRRFLSVEPPLTPPYCRFC